MQNLEFWSRLVSVQSVSIIALMNGLEGIIDRKT
jgi:hypothetical protein